VRITKIERQKKRPDRVSIYADGEFLTGVSQETLLRTALRVGDEISDTLVTSLQDEESLFAARNSAFRLLSVRPRAERELRDRLREKEFSETHIGRVVEDLKRAELVNDAVFARTYIRNALTLRPVGEARIRQKLLLLGVDRATVEEAVRETLGPVDMVAVAREIARKFLRRSRNTGKEADPRKTRQRLSAHLSRRGYSWNTISAVLKSLHLSSSGEEDNE
jgi:regulatory protein